MRDDGFKQNSFLKRDVKMMRTCKNCGKEFDDVYDVCPSCGAYEEEPEDMTEKENETETVPSAADNSSKKDSIKLYNESGFKKEQDAKDLIMELKDKKAVVKEIKKSKQKENAPLLFNLAEIQNECTKRFKIKPDETLEIIQNPIFLIRHFLVRKPFFDYFYFLLVYKFLLILLH